MHYISRCAPPRFLGPLRRTCLSLAEYTKAQTSSRCLFVSPFSSPDRRPHRIRDTMTNDGQKKEKIISRAATQKPPEYPLHPETITGGVMPMEIAGRFEEERARLGPDFNDAERRWRIRWHADQHLTHHEPLPDSEALKAEKYWWFRRFYRKPLDLLEERVFAPRMGAEMAMSTRKFMAKGFFIYLGSLFVWYHLKYLSGSWEVLRRPILYFSKPEVFPGDEGYPLKENNEPWEWFDHGFSKRTAHLNLNDPNRFKI